MIEFLASQPHYREHLQPVCDEIGGRFVTKLEASYGKGLLVVASQRDLFIGRRPAVLLEHGAGQSYGDHNPGYAGGDHRENVQLFLSPNEESAARNRARYPEARHEVIGCPRLDKFAGWKSTGTEIALAFHWPCSVSPESGTAFPYYHEALSGLVGRFGPVIGHGHPRIFEALRKPYLDAGIEPVADSEEVFRRAKVLICDNSSIAWEAQAVGIPTVWLNDPSWRRDVEFGLRFWEFADSGIQVDEPEDLVAGVETALADPPAIRQRRAEAVAHVFGEIDGKAAFRAGQAIEELMRSGRWNQTSMT